MFNLNEVETTDRKSISPYLSYGSNQELKINDIELKVSQNTGSPKAILHMEGRAIEDPMFSPIEGAKGKVGKVACGIYMKTDEQKRELLKKLKTIALALNLEAEVNEINGESFEDVIEGIKQVICGNKWARYTIFAEEYPKPEGKVGIKLSLPRYNFVESLDTTADSSKLHQFDIANPIHFKKLEAKPEGGSIDDISDMPF